MQQMYTDFKITDNGDLLILENTKNSSSTLSFFIHNNKPLEISFAILNSYREDNINTDGKLSISFDITRESRNHITKTIYDNEDEYIEQYISVMLKTIKGELSKRLWFGSEVDNHRFQVITPDLLRRVELSVGNDARKIMNVLSVEATEINNKYKTGLNIKITRDPGEPLIFQTDL